MFSGFHPCFCLRGFLSSPSSSSLVSYLSLLGGVLRSIFSAFSFRSTVLDYFVALVLPVLCFSSVFLRRVFCGFLPSFGGSPFCVSSSSLCFSHTWSLRISFLRPWLRPFQLCSSSLKQTYCLFQHWALPSLPSSWFISPCSPSFLFQSTLHFFSIYWFLRSLPLPLLFLLLPRLLRGLLPFLSRVQCLWVCCLCCGCAQGVAVLLFGVLSLGFVCLAFVLSACYLVPPGLGAVGFGV